MMEENNIDDFFKKGLEEAELVPIEDQWANIESTIDEDKKGVFLLRFTKGRLAAALIILLLGSMTVLLTKLDTLDNRVISLQEELEKSNSTSLSEDAHQDSGQEKDLKQDYSDEKTPQDNTQNTTFVSIAERSAIEIDRSSDEREAGPRIQSNEVADLNTNQWYVSSTAAGHYNSDASMISETKDSKNAAVGKEEKAQTEIALLSVREPLQLSLTSSIVDLVKDYRAISNRVSNQEEEVARPRFSIDCMLGANSTFRRLKATSAEGQALAIGLDKAESPGNTFGLGGRIDAALLPRLKLKTGWEFSQWRQKGDYTVIIRPSDGQESVTSSGVGQWSWETSLNTSSGEDMLAYTSGNNPAIDAFSIDPNATVESKFQITEEVNWWSVPVGLEYQVPTKSLFGFFIGTGISLESMSRSSTTWTESGETYTVQRLDTEFEKSLFTAAYLELGCDYRIGETTSIRVSPRYKTWLTPLYASEDLSSYPYSLAMMVGLKYDL